MELFVLKSKIHTVKVTEANVNYRGSITIDEDLMDAAQIRKFEQVYVNNATNGTRIMTYVIPGKRGSGDILMNGGAALHASEGDTIHILCFCNIQAEDLENHEPIIVHTHLNNEIEERLLYNVELARG